MTKYGAPLKHVLLKRCGLAGCPEDRKRIEIPMYGVDCGFAPGGCPQPEREMVVNVESCGLGGCHQRRPTIPNYGVDCGYAPGCNLPAIIKMLLEKMRKNGAQCKEDPR